MARKRARGGLSFSRREVHRLCGFYGVIAAFHVVGWGLFIYYGQRGGPVYAGAGALAYSFGLRHAFDADHISAVDDSTRFLMQRGQEPLGTGFFFSLGHSTVVVALAVGLASAAESVQRRIPTLQRIGGTVGATVSGTFLMVIAFLDLLILLGVIDVWKKTKSGEYEPEHLDELMMQRGYMNRILGTRWRRFLSDSWHMYPIGLLFGLGFDTASEVGLLALTAAAATGQHRTAGHLPVGGILALPLLFTAGMTLMDTTDGVFMAKAYGWAFSNPIRKVYYNLSTVALGVFVAGGIGSVEYLQVLSTHTHFHGAFWDFLNGLNFELLGYFIVGAFVVFWVASVAWYKLRRFDERYAPALSAAAVESSRH
ncbi:MAG TPA: HoxN/HupN/NixA family nickel/cobalt transporter [Acidimicrobiales bacterium]|nr:HoxN/HupN/NixA family nickel/cobalt transporter [Acidimicrobiales bacterium]